MAAPGVGQLPGLLALPPQRHVVIHVFDEFRKTSRDFTCARGVLLDNMKYFRAFLSDSNELDEIDISVHCDVEIFELLVEYMHHRWEPEWRPRLSLDNIASILVSSEFLQMEDLVDECSRFISSRLQEFVQLRVDLSCLSDASVAKIANKCSADQLHKLQDPKDKILSKLQRNKVDSLVKSLRDLELCACCDTIYVKQGGNQLPGCRKSNQTIGVYGELSGQHQPCSGWQLDTLLRELTNDQAVSWTGVYWYIWAAANWFECSSCRSRCTYLEWQRCAYHPGSVVGQGTEAKYSCCSSRIFNVDEAATVGCKSREHSPVCNEQYAANEPMKSTLLGVWDQITRCAEAVSARSSKSSSSAVPSSLPGAVDAASVFSQFSPATESSAAALDPAAKKTQPLPAEASSSACRKQWRIMQRQERDRARMQQLLRRLMLRRKSATS